MTAYGFMASPAQTRAAIELFGNAGFEVHITELDIRLNPAVGALAQQRTDQQRLYGQTVEACLLARTTAGAAPCKAIVTWGFTNEHSWIPSFFTGEGEALPFLNSVDATGRMYAPAPAYSSMLAPLLR